MTSDGRTITRVTDLPYFEFGGTWSPDGSRIAYVVADSLYNLSVVVANADGSDPVRITGT